MDARKIRRPRRLSIIGQSEIMLENRTINYTLKQSPRIRGIRLEIHGESGLTVVVPRKYDQHNIQDLLHEKSRWIIRHLPKSKPFQPRLFSKEVDHGEKVQYMGHELEVEVSATGNGKNGVYLKGNTLVIEDSHNKRSRAKILEQWYKLQAKLIFTGKADLLQKSMGVRYKNLTIRGQKKRWASASPSGNLSINWKLLLAPEPVIDYVLMHELAHLKHMNHSKKFWDYLAKFCPEWRESRKWLRVHEDDLKSASRFMH
jgi:predicted metal-dependent hydrolase